MPELSIFHRSNATATVSGGRLGGGVATGAEEHPKLIQRRKIPSSVNRLLPLDLNVRLRDGTGESLFEFIDLLPQASRFGHLILNH